MKMIRFLLRRFPGLWGLFLFAVPAGAAVPVSHELEVHLAPATGELLGVDRLTLPAPIAPSLEMFLSAAATVLDVRQAGQAVDWRRTAGGGIRVGPLPPLSGRKLSLEIRYRATFTDQAPQAPLNTEDPSYGVALAIGPEGSFLSGGAGWYPEVPGTENLFRVRIRAPAGYLGVTAGELVQEETAHGESLSVWATRTPLPNLTLAAGPLTLSRSRAGEIPVFTFFSPDHAPLATTYLKSAGDDLVRYQKLFGPYPFPKFAVVENFFPTGYGFPSWTLLGSSIVPLPFIVTTSLAHEIAHSWWGNGVRVDQSHGNWSEGLTTYVADYLLKEKESPAAAREYRLKILRDYATLVPPGQGYPLTAFRARRSKIDQAIGYGKSAMVFHMARQRVGDLAFWRGLRRVAATRMHQNATWGNFARAFDPESRHGMEQFFRQWVERPGAPRLGLVEVQNRQVGNGWEVTGRLRQSSPTYSLRVPVRLETAAGVVEKHILLSGPEAEFRLPVPARPLRLVVDPEVNIFRRLAPDELPATVNSLRASRSLLAVAAHHLDPSLRRAAKDLLVGLNQDPPWLEEAEVTPRALAGHDLLLVGLPRTPALKGAWSGEPVVERGSFRVAGQTYAEAGNVLFAVLPRRQDGGHTVGILYGHPGDGARLAARKIPHYGKYSYLVFRAGRNLAKGTWPVIDSPLIHRFHVPLPGDG